MESRSSPFPCGWYTCGSHQDFWGAGSTYTLVPYGDLPSLDRIQQTGTFAWLSELPDGDFALEYEDKGANPSRALNRLSEQAASLQVHLPQTFVRFLSSRELFRRVPTCTACYLDLSTTWIDAPGVDGKMLRFMNDQQSVLLWYLFLQVGQEPAVVVATPEWLDEPSAESLDEVVRPTDVTFCAETFEEFMLRFWLENTIWFSLHEDRPLTDVQSAYVRAAKATRSLRVRQGKTE